MKTDELALIREALFDDEQINKTKLQICINHVYTIEGLRFFFSLQRIGCNAKSLGFPEEMLPEMIDWLKRI